MPKERKILARWVGATDHRKVEISIKWSQGDSGGPLMYQGEDGRWLLMGTVPAIHNIQSFVTAFFMHTPKFFLLYFLAVATNLDSGEPWDQVRLPQPAWSLHEDDLLQTLDWKSHWGKLLIDSLGKTSPRKSLGRTSPRKSLGRTSPWVTGENKRVTDHHHCPDQQTLDEDTILWSTNSRFSKLLERITPLCQWPRPG